MSCLDETSCDQMLVSAAGAIGGVTDLSLFVDTGEESAAYVLLVFE